MDELGDITGGVMGDSQKDFFDRMVAKLKKENRTLEWVLHSVSVLPFNNELLKNTTKEEAMEYVKSIWND